MAKGRSSHTDFLSFWDAYGLKRDKIAAERAWNRLSVNDRKAAYAGIQAYRDDCRHRGIAMMYAQGYINHRRWEDVSSPVEPVTAPQQPSEMELW